MRQILLLLHEWNGIFTFQANLCSETRRNGKNTEDNFKYSFLTLALHKAVWTYSVLQKRAGLLVSMKAL